MSKKNKVSIIVPVYNGENTIQRCIESILNQSIKNFDLYIVNDGSSDNTNNVIDKYSSIHNVHIINQDNQGVSKARNVALELVNTEYVAFVDSDDYVDYNYLKNLVSSIEKYKVDLVIEGFKKIGNEKVYLRWEQGVYSSRKLIEILLNEKGPQGYLWNKLFKVDIIKNNNLKFDRNIHMAEDLLFCIKYVSKINDGVVLNNCDYNYVYTENSLSNTASILNKNNNYKEAYKNYLIALDKIKENIPKKYIECYTDINARICRADIDFMRTMKLNDISLDKSLYKMLKKNAKRKQFFLYKSSIVKTKTKIYFWLTLCFPNVIKKIDTVRFRKMNG